MALPETNVKGNSNLIDDCTYGSCHIEVFNLGRRIMSCRESFSKFFVLLERKRYSSTELLAIAAL